MLMSQVCIFQVLDTTQAAFARHDMPHMQGQLGIEETTNGYEYVRLLSDGFEELRLQLAESSTECGGAESQHNTWFLAPPPPIPSLAKATPTAVARWSTLLTNPAALMVPIQRLIWVGAIWVDRLWPSPWLPDLPADLAERVLAYLRVALAAQTIAEHTELVQRFVLQGWTWDTSVVVAGGA